MGGRGSGSGGGGGGGMTTGDVISERDMISERERNQALVDQSLEVLRDVNEKYDYVVNQINVGTLKGKYANSVMGYNYDDSVAINQNYFGDRIETAYAKSVAQGFHPSNGDKTGLQAVIAHEMGHALTHDLEQKVGKGSFEKTADYVVNTAKAQLGFKGGVRQMRSKISGYAAQSNVEAIAEAFADVYCNGNKARRESRAIVAVIDSHY